MKHQIIPATETTIAEIETWLDAEEAAYSATHDLWVKGGYRGDPPSRGFRVNWNTAKRHWREGRARIDVLIIDGEAVGFLDGTDILEIRPDLRKSGYGRLLADFMADLAFSQGRSILNIEIAPQTAEPFWNRMGFTTASDRTGNGGGIYAYKVLPRTFALGEGERVPFKVAFYSEEEKYSDNPKPFAQFSGSGEHLPGGSVQLPERAYCFRPTDAQHVDYIVEIELRGHRLLFDKVKRDTSKLLGVELDAGYVYFVDRIRP